MYIFSTSKTKEKNSNPNLPVTAESKTSIIIRKNKHVHMFRSN